MQPTVEQMKTEQGHWEVEVRVGKSSSKFYVRDDLLTRIFSDKNQDWAASQVSAAFTNAYMQEAERTGKRRRRWHDPVSTMELKEEDQNYGE
jgi:hypothetical protein